MEQHNHLPGLLRSSTIIIGDRLLNSSIKMVMMLVVVVVWMVMVWVVVVWVVV